MNVRKTLPFFVWYWLPPIFLVLFIFWLSTIPDLKSTLPAPIDFVLRKTAHMLEFFILTLLFARVQLHGKKKEVHPSVLVGSGALALASAFLDEFVIQRFTPGRFGRIQDVGIDSIGIGAALVFLYLFEKRRKKHV